MNAEPRSNDSSPSAAKTLGDLLYARGKPRISEKEWLRLVQAIAAGDELALQALFERTQRIVFTLMVRITNNRETAEELTIDVFYDVWRRAPGYDPAGGSVLGWIMNQARSRAIDRLRFEQRKKRVNETGESPTVKTTVDQQQVYRMEQESLLLRRALEVLTPEERQAIETAYFSEMTYQEVAAQLHQPLGTIKTRIRSGLSKLRKTLGRI